MILYPLPIKPGNSAIILSSDGDNITKNIFTFELTEVSVNLSRDREFHSVFASHLISTDSKRVLWVGFLGDIQITTVFSFKR